MIQVADNKQGKAGDDPSVWVLVIHIGTLLEFQAPCFGQCSHLRSTAAEGRSPSVFLSSSLGNFAIPINKYLLFFFYKKTFDEDMAQNKLYY